MSVSPVAHNENEGTLNSPNEWITRLTDNGLLRWRYGHENTGLLLAPLLEIAGWHGDVLSLNDALPSGTGTVTISDIVGVMSSLGYEIKSERRTVSTLMPEDLPGLFVFEQPQGWQTGIIMQEINSYGLIWHDGREQHRDALADVKGTLYTFNRPSPEEVADEGAPVQRKDWLRIIASRFRPIFWHAAGLSLVLHFFTLAMPLFSMVVYDRVVAAHAANTLPMLAAGVIGILAVEKVIRWLRIRLSGWLGARSGMLITSAMFERLLFLPASVIEQASVSAQLARIRAFEAVRDFIGGPMFLAMLEAPFMIILVLVIGMLAGPVAFVTLGVIGAYALIMLALRPRWQRLGRDAAHTAAQKQQLLMEMVHNLKPVYAAGTSDKMIQRFRSVSWQASRAQNKFAMIASLAQQIASFMTVVAGIATIQWCLSRVWAGEMTGGAMVATMIITWRVLYPLQILCSILPHMEQVRASAKQVSHLMSLLPEAHAARHVLAERKLLGKLQFQNLGLRYSRKSDPVFLGLNAEIKQGDIVAIYGGNGSGKSSILRMVMGLYAPALGNIRVDDVDHRQFDPRSLRRQIAYLPQAPELLPGTIAENLRTVNPLAQDYKLRQALLWADAWEMVEALPNGLNTMVGEGGITPSSGLAARICLARLYLCERSLILCDELPAQLLNSTTGERFRRYLEECRGKKTVLFVTHREDWLSQADQVIWFKPDGRVVVGRPDKITKKNHTELTGV